MIRINSALKQDEIIKLMEAYDADGLEFTFVKKEGIGLLFETNAVDLEEVSRDVKAHIKAQSWGSVLFFQVVPA